jgi:hypothetical protein
MQYNTKVGEGCLGEEGWKRQSKGENGTKSKNIYNGTLYLAYDSVFSFI